MTTCNGKSQSKAACIPTYSQTDAVVRLLVATANRPHAQHKYPGGYDASCSEVEFPHKRFELELGHEALGSQLSSAVRIVKIG